MKKVLFVCNEGMSTSFIAKKVTEYSNECDTKLEINAFPESSIMEKYKEYDVIMVAPQLSYMHSKIQDRINSEIPVGKLNAVDFGRMNVENIYNSIIEELV